MSHIPTTTPTSRSPEPELAATSGLPRVAHYLKLNFLSGPKVLLTSRISVKCATVMTLMCVPSLLFCSLLTLPALIFESPQQNAYYEFSSVINTDPLRWIVLLMASVCALMSLAVPAAMPRPRPLFEF
jgi:hypothetical protein